MRRRVAVAVGAIGRIAAWPVNHALALGRWAQPWILVAIVVLLVHAWVDDAPWPYALNAETAVATLLPDAATPVRWNVSDAVVCVAAGSRPELADAAEGTGQHCPSGRWHAISVPGSGERVLEIHASPDAVRSDVKVAARPEGGVILQVRTPQGRMSIESPEAPPVQLPAQALVVFPAASGEGWPGDLVLPFSGAIAIGDDARSGQAGILHRGDLTIYTRSDESISGRGLVDSVALLPGDRIEASLGNDPGTINAKGFIHATLARPGTDAPMPGFRVVAFGQAEDVRIVRFGEQSRAFRPGAWARISRHSVVGTWIAGLLGALGLMAMYREASSGTEHAASPGNRDAA